MKTIRLALILPVVLLCSFALHLNAQSTFDRDSFYDAMADDNLQQIEQQLKAVEKANGADKRAFHGTLTMKKAGLVSGPGKKLKLFKAGHKELEASINQDQDNAEYRFLRLMIQEHAPGILGYKDEIQNDSDYIRKSYKHLPEPVQKAVLHYAKDKSKVLTEKDLIKTSE